MAKKKLLKSKLKTAWMDVGVKDYGYWLGQYLLASMVLRAWDKKFGCPDRVGKIGDMKENKDGTGTLPFYAEWD